MGVQVKFAISLASSSVFKAIGGQFTKAGGFFDAGVKNGFGHIMSHALTGGVISTLRGGKFGHGFFSAGITKGLTPHFEGAGGSGFEVNGYNVAEATIAGVLGGTISQVTGGKFANGAITAAMGNLFNNQHNRRVRKTFNELVERDDAGSKQQAINLAVKHFGIDLEHKGKHYYPLYNSELNASGGIDNG